MDDRELLELAAKAYGGYYSNGALWIGREVIECEWNPLTDDGDALRLAVKLDINIEHMKTMGGSYAGVNCWPYGRGDCGASEEISDPYSATRRAIVRAAAEIGKKQNEMR